MKDTEGWNYLNQEAFQIEPADDLDLTKDVRIIEWQNGWAVFFGNMLLCETTSYHQAITLKWIMERLQRNITLAEMEARHAPDTSSDWRNHAAEGGTCPGESGRIP